MSEPTISTADAVQLLTYLAPSIPEELFIHISSYLEQAISQPFHLSFDSSRSGPKPPEPEPFTSKDADVAFICATSYVWLQAQGCLELLGAVPLWDDARNGGEPIYFADVVVHKDSAITRAADLVGKQLAYNDAASLSGYYSARARLHTLGMEQDVALFCSGSHIRSLELVAEGRVNAAAVDSNALAIHSQQHPQLRKKFRVIDTWGPHPVQPIAVRSDLNENTKRDIKQALLRAHLDASLAPILRQHRILRFVEIDETAYDPVRFMFEQIGEKIAA